jgi:putative nucleotidyltransferase with HDIG domain
MTLSASDVVAALGAARRAVQLYPPSHPAFGEALDALIESVRESSLGGPLVLNLHQGRLYNGSVVLTDDVHGMASVAEAFESRHIESLTFQPGFTSDDALGLVEVLTLRPGPDLDIEAELLKRGVIGVSVAFVEDQTQQGDGEERQERDRLREQDRALYQRLLSNLRGLSTQLASGGGADLSQTGGLVTGVMDRLMTDPAAVLGLATIRGVGERTLFHSLNVMIYALALGNRLGLPQEGLSSLGTGALLHDIGKSAFDQGDLMQVERMHVLHPQIGAEILQRLALEDPAPMLVAYEHHMNVDGQGFPERPDGYIAHPYSRMVAIADRYENLTNPGAGREALTPDRAIVQVLREAGTALDPFFARLFASALGAFPVGCIVRLTDQSVGVVVRSGEDPLAPVVRLTYDARGVEQQEPEEVDLSVSPLNIVEVVPQESLNVDVSEKL